MEFNNKYFNEMCQELEEDQALNRLKTNMHSAKDKDFESFVVANLIYYAYKKGLDFRTQYTIKGYHTDLYFPELKLAIECDEAQHFKDSNIKADAIRAAKIKAEIPGVMFVRIDAHQTLDKIVEDIDEAKKIIAICERKVLDRTKFDYNTKDFLFFDVFSKYLKDNGKDLLGINKFSDVEGYTIIKPSKGFKNIPPIVMVARNATVNFRYNFEPKLFSKVKANWPTIEASLKKLAPDCNFELSTNTYNGYYYVMITSQFEEIYNHPEQWEDVFEWFIKNINLIVPELDTFINGL